MKGVKHLELIKLAQKYWVTEGTNKELCTYPNVNHNISCSVIVDDQQEVIDYIWKHKQDFTAVSFISDFGDKDFIQAPFTSVSTFDQLVKDYGHGVIFASGLVVDGLHYYNNNLWEACKSATDKSTPLSGTKEDVILKKYWLSRVKKFAYNFFDGNVQQAIYCLKDVHLYHRWVTINRQFHEVDFGKILNKPKYVEISKFAAMSCSGGQCEITRI
jgi:ribonucleoside-diphosphate reductase alpha chain